jgi:hypothetical protein
MAFEVNTASLNKPRSKTNNNHFLMDRTSYHCTVSYNMFQSVSRRITPTERCLGGFPYSQGSFMMYAEVGHDQI